MTMSSLPASTNILSDKVNRALHVRTDTPAMRTALATLTNLVSPDSSLIDARSVRAAIEQDALQCAIGFQKELQRLAEDASTMRKRVEQVVQMAELVGGMLESSVGVSLGTETDNSQEQEASWERERQLASQIFQAHQLYLQAVRRQNAIEEFLDKFDLGEEEAHLLDHFHFQGFLDSNERGEPGSNNNLNYSWLFSNDVQSVVDQPSQQVVQESMEFLDALEKLVFIRHELSKTFAYPTDMVGQLDQRIDHPDQLNDGDEHWENHDLQKKTPEAHPHRQLGTNSALRMMEQLASRQEAAQERLYHFIQIYLGIGSKAPQSSTNIRNVPTSSSHVTNRHYPYGIDAALYTKKALGRFHDGDEMDEAYAHVVLRRSLHVLRNSPSRYNHALELIASSRRTEVTRRFLLALTSGYGGMAPLEMKAHDPVSYVGDMLAFAFRTFRVEGDLVRNLLIWEKKENEVEMEKTVGMTNVHSNSATFEKGLTGEQEDAQDCLPMSVVEMLSQSMGGLARPLGTRIIQVVKSLVTQGGRESTADFLEDHFEINNVDDDLSMSSLDHLVALFSISGLLKFYCMAVQKTLDRIEQSHSHGNSSAGEDRSKNTFFVTCEECLIEASDSYVASLRAYGAMLATHATPMENEAQLAQRAIIRISEERVSSPGFSEDSLSSTACVEDDVVSKQLSLSLLVSTIVDAAIPYLRSLDDGANLISAINAATKCGMKASEANKWIGLIYEKQKDLVEKLVDVEVVKVLEHSGLAGIRSSIQHMNAVFVEGMSMSSHPGLLQEELEVAMKQFYSSLLSPLIPTFEDIIKDSELRKVAKSQTAQRIVEEYKNLYNAITSERGGYSDLAFLEHTPDQVQTLLSI